MQHMRKIIKKILFSRFSKQKHESLGRVDATTKTAHKQNVGEQEPRGYIDANVPPAKSTQISTSDWFLGSHFAKKHVCLRTDAALFGQCFARSCGRTPVRGLCIAVSKKQKRLFFRDTCIPKAWKRKYVRRRRA